MPRRQYVADLAKAHDGVSIAGISNVNKSDNDGEFTFLCFADGCQYKLLALIPEVSDYPSSHMYMLIGPDDVPQSIGNALAGIAESAFGKSIEQLLELTSRSLNSTDREGDQHMIDSQDYDGLPEQASDDEEADNFFSDDEDVQKPFSMPSASLSNQGFNFSTPEFRSRIRSDLCIAKAAGFKVGYLGGLTEGGSCYVSVSCRISKLGVSDEAMQAWQVQPWEYLVVVFSYPNGYKNMDDIQGYDNPTARHHFRVKIGICSTYKPTMQEAIQAFAQLSTEEEMKRERDAKIEKDHEIQSQGAPVHKGFRNSFISRPLHDLLDSRFPQLLKFRYNGMSWNGAEEFYHDSLGATPSELGLEEKYMSPEPVSTAYSSLVTADHITDPRAGRNHSLPLVGMQYVLRHFVRCTEFCLVCFRKMQNDLQAIKPYVCEQPLCLYQYMSLGFGPSIEHEILSQPKVVDLLISFCHSSAFSQRLQDFPAGLSLMVPYSTDYQKDYVCNPYVGYAMMGRNGHPSQMSTTGSAPEGKSGLLRYNSVTKEIIFDDPDPKCPFKVGDWMVIRTTDDSNKALHCRIADTYLYPTITVSEPIEPAKSQLGAGMLSDPTQKLSGPSEFKHASYSLYDQNFDSLTDHQKREVIGALLDLLPSVNDMKNYLLRKKQSTLSSWVDRLSPASLGVLRWIIASNRACIMQVDEGQERLCGMHSWTQFRFAMGAPDKERRFVHAVRDTSAKLHLKHDTIFAWHGSPLQNWHSIIREGLHFKSTAHGRAFGHGVYHALDSSVSLSYTAHGMGLCGWAMSDLKVGQALALNEIVNAPNEFISKNPHLVVAQLDWIQTRYLFIRTQSAIGQSSTGSHQENPPQDPIEQDSLYTPRGTSGLLVIPRSAIPSHRTSGARTVDKYAKRRKTAKGANFGDPIEIDGSDDCASVTTQEEDLKILDVVDNMPKSENVVTGTITPAPSKGKGKVSSGFRSKTTGSRSALSMPVQSLTDYEPGTLDYKSLPMLAQPAWATPSATRRLMQDFQAVVEIQSKTPLHELGWHIDEDQIENMYQWIVELHSFDSTLPLASDMRKAGVKSVVLEMRFGKDYPMSPPFVRVIRPRFLGFSQGGGGHVTLGGAICMELLTNNGWSAVSTIESVLLQVRVEISSFDPKPARLENRGRSDYGVGEAVEAYIRACDNHGWTVPIGFRETALGGDVPGSGYR